MDSNDYMADDWPKMPDGSDFDGKQLLTMTRSGKSPFHGSWDVNVLIKEIEEKLNFQVIDIPTIDTGANNYGIHLKLSNRPDVLARLANNDVNMPNYNSYPFDKQAAMVKFEAAVYELLRPEPNILVSHLLCHRIPVQHNGPRLEHPRDIAGRGFLLFEKAEGEENVWNDIGPEKKACLLTQTAYIRASLIHFNLPSDFASTWFLSRLFEQKPESLPIPVTPTREFCVAVFTSKIEATIKNIGDTIGWPGDNFTVGPIAAAAKQFFLRLVPHIMPADSDQDSFYRLVLDHWDFGIHNMSITTDVNGQPLVTSIYDWETGCIMPALLSDLLMMVAVDLRVDENGAPSITRVDEDTSPEDRARYMTWAKQYFKVLFEQAPDYERVIEAGKDARHLWFALRDWRGDDPEGYFGDLGVWAERRMKELGVE